MEINYLLYGLYDPNDKNLKYVGITVRSLNERLNDHCKQPTNPRMKKWINNLRKYRINKEKSNIYSFDVDHIKKLLSMGKKQKDIAKIYNCSAKYMNKFIHKKILNV